MQSHPKEVRPPSEEIQPPLKGASHPMKEVGPGQKDKGPSNALRLHLDALGHPRENAKPSLKDARCPANKELITKTTNSRFPKKIEKPITSISSSPSSLIPTLEGKLTPAKPEAPNKPNPETKTTSEP